MTAYNSVRFRVKPGMDEKFIATQRSETEELDGFEGGALIKTGDRTYCFVGRWKDFDSIVAARPKMTSMLDRSRDLLEDLGSGLGVTDPVSGSAVVEFPPTHH